MLPKSFIFRSGKRNSGSPLGITPTVLNPIAARGVNEMTRTDIITTTIATGLPGKNFCPAASRAIAVTPNISTYKFVSGSCFIRNTKRSIELSPPEGTPKSFGSWVSPIAIAAPALKPSSTISLMKFIILLRRSKYARMLIAANTSADNDARSTHR